MGRRLGAIALLAVLVRAIIPAGYMLAHADTDSGRYLVVEMCEGHGQVGAKQVIDLDTGKEIKLDKLPKKTGGDPGSAPCVFAGAVAMAQPVTVAEPVEFLTEQQVDFAAVRDLRPGRGIAAPPPPSTGPPSKI